MITIYRSWFHGLGVIAFASALGLALGVLAVLVFVAQVTTDISWAQLAKAAWIAALP
jgi:uncharacterized membrane protein YqgA involved in biofilm formation